MNVKKLLLHERVEVRQFEEGLRGSWHPGVVVGVSELSRSVEYDELLSETCSSKLIESIPVTEAIEGLHRRCHVPATYRGHIRPIPPQPEPDSCKSKLNFGVCVDAFFEDAWWEGVIFDENIDSNERFVYFPDEGDERKFSVSNLRVSRMWDEYFGQWKERGIWILVELANRLEGGAQFSHFIKRVWVRLRSNYGFLKMISEWTCSIQSLWSRYFREVVDEIAIESTSEDLLNHNIPACLFGKGGKKSKIPQQTDSKSFLYNPELQLNNPNGFNLIKSSQDKKQKTSPDQHSSKKQSLNIKLRSKKQTHLRIEKSNENSFQADSLRGRHHLTAGISFMQGGATAGGKCDQLSNGCGCRSKNKLNTFPPTKSKQSLKNYKAEKQKLLIAHEPEGNQNKRILNSESQSGSRKTTSDVSLLQNNKTGKVKFCKSRNDCMHHNKRKIFRVSSSKRRQQLVRKSSALKKSNPIVTYKHKINRHALDSSRLVNEPPTVSNEQVNRPASKRRNVTKLKQTKNDFVRRNPICGRRQSHKEASIKTKVRSTSGKRIAKIIKKSNAKVKAPSKDNFVVLDAIQTQGDISASWRHPVLPFANSGSKVRLKDMVSPQKRKRKRNSRSQSDPVCIICQDGGDLILCDHCPTSYHVNCIQLKDVPDGTWFCPLCCCGLCGLRNPNSDNPLLTDVCHQCNRQYHLGCLSKVGENPFEKFCSKNCFELCQRLHQLLGISYRTSVEGLTWKMIRSTKNDFDFHNTSKIDTRMELSRALEVMHECFQPVIEPHTKRDLVHDVIFNSISKFRRLDFRGFYVMVLQKGSELVSVATIRIHGQKVAEMPLIGTPFDYRRQGMCRVLVQELEKMLTRLGVERIVLPAISQLSETWKSSFGFSEMSICQRQEFIGYPFLCFYGTKMFQKAMSKSMTIKETRDSGGASQESGGNNLIFSQEYQIVPDSGKKFFGLCYTRKTKMGKENMVGRPNENVSACKYVYKRRRILANK